MKQKYASATIIIASVACTLLAAASFSKLAQITSGDEAAKTETGAALDSEFDNGQAEDLLNEALFDDFFSDGLGDFTSEENTDGQPPLGEIPAFDQQMQDVSALSGSVSADQANPFTNDAVEQQDDTGAVAAPPAASAPRSSAPVFYRNGKVVEIALPKQNEPAESPPEDETSQETQTGSSVSAGGYGSGAISAETASGSENDYHPSPAQTTQASEKKGNGKMPVNTGGLSSIMIVSAAGTIILFSLIIIFFIVRGRKKKTITQHEAFETKPAQVFAQNSSERLAQALGPMENSGGAPATPDAAGEENFPNKYLDRNAVLPVTHQPQGPVKEIVGEVNEPVPQAGSEMAQIQEIPQNNESVPPQITPPSPPIREEK